MCENDWDVSSEKSCSVVDKGVQVLGFKRALEMMKECFFDVLMFAVDTNAVMMFFF